MTVEMQTKSRTQFDSSMPLDNIDHSELVKLQHNVSAELRRLKERVADVRVRQRAGEVIDASWFKKLIGAKNHLACLAERITSEFSVRKQVHLKAHKEVYGEIFIATAQEILPEELFLKIKETAAEKKKALKDR